MVCIALLNIPLASLNILGFLATQDLLDVDGYCGNYGAHCYLPSEL
jgi:hypothetical protein